MSKPNDQWVSKAQFVWEQANGREWPKGHRSMFADGDRLNFDPENIVPVPNDLYTVVCGAVPGGLEWHDRESLEAAITMAKVRKESGCLSKITVKSMTTAPAISAVTRMGSQDSFFDRG
jgi:hypothetical protein